MALHDGRFKMNLNHCGHLLPYTLQKWYGRIPSIWDSIKEMGYISTVFCIYHKPFPLNAEPPSGLQDKQIGGQSQAN